MEQGTRVWVLRPGSPDAYALGTILSGEEGGVQILLQDGSETITAEPDHVFLANKDDDAVADLLDLSYLSIATILHNLRLRHADSSPYTYTKTTCLAVNPFKWLNLYNEKIMTTYHRRPVDDLPPHIFAVAERAFMGMIKDSVSQSILVSGESGSGKTETTKLLLRFLASIGNADTEQNLSEQVLQSNPILEAFGNAKTVRNDNSSRFGKFIEVKFNAKGTIAGAVTHTYLLEKSRITSCAPGERNYHVFYHLLNGATPELLSKLKLGAPTDFSFLKHTNLDPIPSLNDSQCFERLCTAMKTVGISEDEVDCVFRVVAAVLHLGEISFEIVGDDECTVAPGCRPSLETAASLLHVEVNALVESLCTRSMQVAGQSIFKKNTTVQALASRDALAKAVYAQLFAWLVSKINQASAIDTSSVVRSINILDIFGFERFEKNSFEQLCINYANEKLQQQYVADTFKSVQEEYIDEGIEWDFIDYTDNQDCLDLIEGKLGIIALLNEECVMPNGSEETFVRKLTSVSEGSDYFSRPKSRPINFIVNHYAGPVEYNSEGFLDKNKDSVHADILGMLRASTSQFISHLFAGMGQQPSGSSGKKPNRNAARENFLGSQFQQQLKHLMQTICGTNVQYIRCFKPNTKQSADMFEGQLMVDQLEYAGVLNAIEISRSAFPNRLLHGAFLDQYGILSAGSLDATAGAESCIHLLKVLLGENGYAVGRTRVYFKYGVLETLEKKRREKVSEFAVRIQAIARGWWKRRTYNIWRRAAVCIQRYTRGYVKRKGFVKYRRALIVCQSVVRRHLAKKRCRDLRKFRAASRIQATFKMAGLRREYLKKRANAVKIQAYYRMKLEKACYAVALAEHREQAKLENQLAAMQSRLQSEMQARAELEERLEHKGPEAAGDATLSVSEENNSLLSDVHKTIAHLQQKISEANKKAEDEALGRKAMVDAMKLLDEENQSLRTHNALLEKARDSVMKRCHRLTDEMKELKKALEHAMVELCAEKEEKGQVTTMLQGETSKALTLEENNKRLTEELKVLKQHLRTEAEVRVGIELNRQELLRENERLKRLVGEEGDAPRIRINSAAEAAAQNMNFTEMPEYAQETPSKRGGILGKFMRW